MLRIGFPWRTLGLRGLLYVLAGIFVSRTARAQEHPIQIVAELRFTHTVYARGDETGVIIATAIPSGWHLYSLTQPPGGPIATTINVGPSSVVRKFGAIKSPVPIIAPDPNFGIESEWYQDEAAFIVPLKVAPDAPLGPTTLVVRIGYQTCNARYCLPPTEDTLLVPMTVGVHVINNDGPAISGTGRDRPIPVLPAAPAAITPPANSTLKVVNSTSSRGELLAFLWLAATMGALSLLTPCVFPMVPITISYFSRRGQVSKGRAIGDALLYAGGIVIAFTGLGVGLSLLMGVAGLNRFAADPWLNLAIAALFIFFAMSLFEVLHVSLPSGLLTWLDRASGGSQVGRVATSLLMGVTFAVTTFTCTAPLVGTLLVSATRGDWRWPMVGLLVFSSVFALPFLVLALVPQVLTRLPKSGEWMVTVKGTLGFIELAAALKFLSNADLVQGWGIFTRQTVISLWVVLGVLLVLYLFGLRIGGTGVRRSARWHPIASTAALAMTGFIALGLTGRRLGELEPFLPPAGGAGESGAAHGELPWRLNDLDGALAEATKAHKFVLIDFTGYTCTNCRWMEANMFPRAEVVRELDQFVRVRLFTDGRDSLDRKQQLYERDTFGTVALPLYAVVDAQGAPRATFLGMTRDADEFVKFLTGSRSTR
jgi:thiol:disulfide interchange protein